MPSPRKSAARLFASSCLTVAGLMLAGGIAGCDSETEVADKAVTEQLRAAEPQRGEEAIKTLEQAAQQAGASAGATAHAKALLAQAEVEQAQGILRQIDANNVTTARLLSEIADIAGRVSGHNTAVAGYLKLSPEGTDALAKWLTDEQAKLEGQGADATWDLGGDAGKLPALSALTAKATQLGEEVKTLEAKKAELVAQRTEADKKAGETLTQSKRKTGKESVDLFTQSATASKQAADLANQITQLDHELMKKTQDLALAEAQAAELTAASKEIADLIAATKKAEQQLQTLTESQKALSNALVNGDGTTPAGDTGDTATPPADAPPVEAEESAEPAAFQVEGAAPAEEAAAPAEGEAAPAATPSASAAAKAPPSTIITNSTMAAKAKELEGVLADTTAKRKTAVDLLTSAIGHYDGAIADAQKLRTELQSKMTGDAGQAPQVAAWRMLSEAYNTDKLNLRKARVQHLLAAVHRDEAIGLVARKKVFEVVRDILKDASLDVPAGLEDPKLEEQLDAAQVAANESYEATQTLLQEEVIDKASGADAEQTRAAGQIAQVAALYGRSLLSRALNDSANADKFFTAAKQTVANGAIPADQYPTQLRSLLGLLARPTTAPSPQPATSPAPTDGATAPETPAPGVATPGAVTPTEPATPAPAPAEPTPPVADPAAPEAQLPVPDGQEGATPAAPAAPVE